MSAGQRRGFRVPPLSTKNINRVAANCRRRLFEIDDDELIDLSYLVESYLPSKLGVHYDIREIEVMKDVEAAINPDKGELLIREDVYYALTDPVNKGHGRARFTIAHEFGHLFLHEGISLNRHIEHRDHKFFEDSEWQADTFASELLMPRHLCETLSLQEIRQKFVVSYSAAKIKFENMNMRG